MSDLENLLNFDHQTQALNQISGRLGWDQETMMPSGICGTTWSRDGCNRRCVACSTLELQDWRMVE